MHKLKSFLENGMDKILRNFEIQTDRLIPARRLDLVIIKKKKKKEKKKKKKEPAEKWTLPSSADHTMKIKENERRNKCLDLAKELKKLWNMKVTFIPIVIGAPEMIPEDLVRRL